MCCYARSREILRLLFGLQERRPNTGVLLNMKRLTKVTARLELSWDKSLANFLSMKAANRLSRRTIKDYRYHVELFFGKYPEAWGDYDNLRQSVLEYFAGSIDLSPDTYNTRRKCLKAFFRWCVSEGIIPADPTEGLKVRKTEGRIRDIPLEVLQKLITLPDRSTYTGLRDYALILLSLDNGIRPSEALSLLPSDFNFSSMEVHVRAEIAKTRVSRTLPLSQSTCLAIRKLLTVRPDDWEKATMFCSCDGRQLAENGWRLRLDRYKKKLKHDISPYDLRHCFAIMYLRNGGDPFTLQRIMGHTSMEMTRRYLKFSSTDIQNAHSAASPLASLLGRKKKVVKVKE